MANLTSPRFQAGRDSKDEQPYDQDEATTAEAPREIRVARAPGADAELADDGLLWLRGHGDNPLVDLATPLLILVSRVSRAERVEDVEELYRRVVADIERIEQEAARHDYDQHDLLDYRYVLCSFIDEAVMLTTWGQNSRWGEYSLLARFHQETFGGEKVFSILSRLRQEPRQHRDLLHLIFLCLCLGFQGRYRLLAEGHELCERLMVSLGEQLVELDGSHDAPLMAPVDNVLAEQQRSGDELPTWLIAGLFGLFLLAVYAGLGGLLSEQASQVRALLDQIIL